MEGKKLFWAYVEKLKLKTDWAGGVSKEKFELLYNSVESSSGLVLDGESVFITYDNGVLGVDYDYTAFLSVISSTYPETTFDFGLMYEGDLFEFNKINGKIEYTHLFGDRFKTNKVIIGAYAIIKNKKGEFIETISLDDINKMKNSATNPETWLRWYDRMCLKSVIKRVCNVHFKEIVKAIAIEDNKTVNPDNCNIDSDVSELIKNCKDTESLKDIYNEYISDCRDKEQLIKLIGEKRKELKND